MSSDAFIKAAVLTRRWLIVGLAAFLLLFLGACATTSAPASQAAQGTSADPTRPSRMITVYRSPDCSCCHVWADLAREAGWNVTVVDATDMATFKNDRGVPPEAGSCHTALVGDYVIEGHVPFAAVDRLLSERPDIDGIALPGMPAGSPGMGGVQEAPFEVLAIDDGEVVEVFGSY